jgi:hypothetical protein
LERVNNELIKEVWPAIDKLRDQQSEMNVSIATIGEQLKAIAGSIVRVENCLDRMSKSQDEEYKKALAGWKRGTITLIGSGLAGLGALLGWLLQWLLGGK